MAVNNYFLLTVTTLFSCIFFIVLIQMLEHVPKKYHDSINLVSSIGIVFAVIQVVLAYYSEQQDDAMKKAIEYSDGILQGFEKIDDYLMQNYESLYKIIDIIYNQVQIPSSDVDLNALVNKMDKKTKDTLFMIYGKLTILFEKMYLIDPSLFDNDKLGVRVRLYTDTMFYYEYWSVAKTMYSTRFVDYMHNKYTYLTIPDHKFDKPDRDIYRIPYINDNSFIFKSPTQDGVWH